MWGTFGRGGGAGPCHLAGRVRPAGGVAVAPRPMGFGASPVERGGMAQTTDSGTAPGADRPVTPARSPAGATDAPRTPRTAKEDGPGPSAARLLGLDLARGLAVFGMYAAHLGPTPELDEPTGFLMELAHGRSSALFAVLAGVTLVILAGRQQPKTGRAGHQAALRITIRALVLIALGTALTANGTDVEVILAYYGLFFLLALPFARLSSRALAVIAAAWALVGPQVLYVVAEALWDSPLERAVMAHDPLARASDGEGILQFLISGSYPALSWLPFVFAGMAIGRLDLRAARVRARLAATGGALAVLGHGAAWLALLTPWGRGLDMPNGWWADTDEWPEDTGAAQLLLASPHSGTTLSLVANTGVALVVIAAALAAMDRLPGPRRLAAPVLAVGSMSLSAYVFHIVAIKFLGINIEADEDVGIPVLLGFIAAVSVLAYGWSRLFRRGPLEYVVHRVSQLSRLLR